MSQQNVRILAQWMDDPTESLFTLDARIDDARRIVGHWALFGAIDLDAQACAPFVLRPDGTMDFGAQPDRRWRTDLRARIIKVDETFTIHWNDVDHGTYKIEKVAVLGSKEH
jgi:hypothetical protein